MEKLKELRKGNQMKEFQNIIGNVLRVRKKIFVAREIRDPETPEEIVYEPDRIRRLILDKYGKLYGSDHEKFYFEIGNIEPTTSKDICRAAELVSVDKELGIDCIPDYNDPEGFELRTLMFQKSKESMFGTMWNIFLLHHKFYLQRPTADVKGLSRPDIISTRVYINAVQ